MASNSLRTLLAAALLALSAVAAAGSAGSADIPCLERTPAAQASAPAPDLPEAWSGQLIKRRIRDLFAESLPLDLSLPAAPAVAADSPLADSGTIRRSTPPADRTPSSRASHRLALKLQLGQAP